MHLSGQVNQAIMKKQIPFDFLLDYLPANTVIRPAIGMYYAEYLQLSFLLILSV